MYNRFLFFLSITLAFANLASAQPAKKHDVIIDELFPDPSPSAGLPTNEFIELKNISTTPLNLKAWKISDGSSTATITTDFILQPDSFVIICPNSAVNTFTAFGAVIGATNFPSLNNDADVIILYSPEGSLIHAVGYSVAWYQNDIKSDGGWSIEMIDTKFPCGTGNNWKASTNNNGGTPGTKNAVDAINKDEMPPALRRTYTLNDSVIVAVFDETLDSAAAAITSNYQLDNNAGSPAKCHPLAPLFNEVQLTFSVTLNPDLVYNLKINSVPDCAGNMIGTANTARAGAAVNADSFDIVINEILFNPKADGYDFVELYNRSGHIVDLKQLHVASRNNTGTLSGITPLSSTPYLLFPDEYIVFTENVKWLRQNYTAKSADRILEISQLPSLPDDKGNLVITNTQGSIIDEVSYDHKWHFALINNEEGVSLERVNYSAATQNKTNWTSASSTSGFGTPGYQNSQLRADQQIQGNVTIEPRLFSPDNDGYNDYGMIYYQLADPGFVANVSIFDINGRSVRALVKNATLAQAGYFRWDGLDDKQQKLPAGIYVVYTEVFNLQGQTKKFKNVVTIAKRL